MADAAPKYSRVYHHALDDPKFANVWDDDHALSCWLRLLVSADMAWPSPATLYHGINRKALDLLVSVGLVDMQSQSGSRYRIDGLDAEREARSESARNAAAVRWHSGRNAELMRPHANGNAEVMPSRAEQSKEIVSTTPPGYKEARPRLGVVIDPEGTH